MRIRTYLAILIFFCLLGGYSLERILSSQFELVQQHNRQFNLNQLLLKDLENVKFNISQYLLSADLVLGSGNTYLISGTQQQGVLLISEFSIIKNSNNVYESSSLMDNLVSDIEQINNIMTELSTNGLVDNINNKDLLDKYDIISKDIVHNVQKILSITLTKNQHQQSELESINNEKRNISIIARTLFLILVIILWYWFSKKICDPLWSLREASLRAQSGEKIKPTSSGPLEIIDLSKHIKRLTDDLTYQADRDPLTGLFNRRVFERVLKQSCSKSQRIDIIAFVDLDYFKTINDTQGHNAGDEVLLAVGRSLSENLRATDTVARIGGDEFAILLPGCPMSLAGKIGEKIRKSINQVSFGEQQKNYRLSVSIGLAKIEGSIDNIAIPMKYADTACRIAKKMGRNNVYIYNEEDDEDTNELIESLSINEVNHSLANNLFKLYKQDIIDLENPVLNEQVEILIRLEKENGDIIPPAYFLPVAERYQVGTQIDRWVVNATIDWFVQQPEVLKTIKKISINLSSQSVNNDDFEKFVKDKLTQFNFPAHKLCFEITETAAIGDVNLAKKFMGRLKDIGCSFALDDFGSGYSSYSNIKDLPAEIIKIDGSFVKDMLTSKLDHATIKSICEVAKMAGQKVVAEYVENKAVADALLKLGVDYAQGYYFSRPESIDNLIKSTQSSQLKSS